MTLTRWKRPLMQPAAVALLRALAALLLCALPGIAFAQESSEASASR